MEFLKEERTRLRFIDSYRDGGTKLYRDNKGNEYYVDFRSSSDTKGKIFNKYPKDSDAVMINGDIVTYQTGEVFLILND